jgi:type I restriction enzyme S subunit
MIDELPQGWTTAPLADLLVALESGSRPRGGVRGITKGVPSIGGEHLKYDGAFDFTSVKYVPEKFAAGMKRGRIQANDILVVKDGATTGKTAFVDGTFPFKKAVVNEHVFICRPTPEIEPRFLFRFLTSRDGQGRMLENFKGSAQGGINQSFAPNTEIPLAPLNEERRIVAKLEKLLGKVDACQQRLAKIPVLLKRFRQSVLAAACSGRLTADWRDGNGSVESAQGFFEKISTRRQEAWKKRVNGRYKRKYPAPENFDSENLPDVPESWMWVSADAICSQITDGEHIQPPYQTEGYPMLSAKHVRDGFVTMEDAGLISESDFKKALKRCEPVNGDVLIVSVGATTGRAAIVRDCPPFAIVRSVLLLKPLVPAEFFLRWLQGAWCFRWMTRASGASAQPHFYIRDTKRLPVAFPPLAEQKEIVRRVEALFALADQIEARYAKAKAHVEKLTQSILAKALRGELVPQDPNDEPASELLKRIKLHNAGSKR